MPIPPLSTSAADELALISRAFAPQLLEGDLYSLLAYLNGCETHRFTGVYRFEPQWVVSVSLFDREAPATRVGDSVKMMESYCWLTGLGASYVIEDASVDSRLHGHAARDAVRSYLAVVLRDKRGTPWGTLCHYDFEPRTASEIALARLERFRPLIQEMFVRDTAACWTEEQPAGRRTAMPGQSSPTSVS
ncbi:MAG: GAF domain-containing protein [Gemmatimonadaceae bacterium]|nr:GAF domain-containing protein [Gemmatimonadaceae bacterium]